MSGALDTLLDRAIVPGYSRFGFRLRRRSWPEGGAYARLDGQTVVLSGATSGLGRAAALELVALGARLVLLVRSRERGEQVRAELARTGGPGAEARVELVLGDLGDLSSVRAAAAELLAREAPVDVLINNAGVMPPQRTLSPDGIELTLATNVVGPFLLTNLLEPSLEHAARAHPGRGRVIIVSSGGMYGQRIHLDDLEMSHEPYSGVTAYARSKRAQVILTELWARRWADAGLGVHAMHPGWADTEGVRESLPRFYRLTAPLLRSPAEGADTIVWLAGAPAAALGSGDFWHDRERRPRHLLARTRESPADREALWERLCALSGWSAA
ncbi:MAG TPA: SDR family NAD(P)-dependent oxidoreductase [Solirubrobacteraceae bacterium]|nr:SDR family NAD(P)-dependent oxidoreductase [Solirubrobacteraceae bacterium]